LAHGPSVTELETVDRVTEASEAVHQVEGWSPDIFIKMIPDLDTIFFGDVLLGNILVKWETPDNEVFQGTDNDGRPPLCSLELPNEYTNEYRDGQCRIWINAEAIFTYAPDPFRTTWVMLLSKLVVSRMYPLLRIRLR